ncbi:MAG TPA: HEPN domain-containing protein [Thermoanaerobaculia bacterium]|nr:HEPN domain-containing protein [Thermoanaerobaculia bacterium]
MSLNDWLKFGWLTEHKTTAQEIGELLGLVERDLVDAELDALSADWKLNIAYNAALQAATTALAACGYRAAREAHHYRVIQSLRDTIGASGSLVARLDVFRKKRNQGGYERAGVISEQEAEEMIELAREIDSAVRRWLAVHRPDLL